MREVPERDTFRPCKLRGVREVHFLLWFSSHRQTRMSSRSLERRTVVETLIRRVAISQMKRPDAEATTVLEAMKMEAA
jgi:hypothetical protein